MTNGGYKIITNLVIPVIDRAHRCWPTAKILQDIFRKTLKCLQKEYILFLWDETRNIFDIRHFPTLAEIYKIYATEELGLQTVWSTKGILVEIERQSNGEKCFYLRINIYNKQNIWREGSAYFAFAGNIYITDTLENLALFEVATSLARPGQIGRLQLPTIYKDRTIQICTQYNLQKYGPTFGYCYSRDRKIPKRCTRC